LLGFASGFLAAEAASYFSKRFRGSGVGIGIVCVERGLVRCGRGWIFFAGFDAGLLFRRENFRTLQVVVAVNVFVGFLLSGRGSFASFFLTRRFGNVLRANAEGTDRTQNEHGGAEAQASLNILPDWTCTAHRLPRNSISGYAGDRA
jgi:hypothetical protein